MKSLFLITLIAIASPAYAATDIESDATKYYSVAPPAAWIEIERLLPNLSPAESEGSVDYLFFDRQVRVRERGVSYYTHFVTRALNESGVNEESHIKIDFSPSSEKITLHTLQVQRGGEVLDQFGRVRASVLRRENSLEEGILDGSLTLSLFLEDIQVGDTISYSYTRDYYEEVLGGKFFAAFTTQWSGPIKLEKLRVLYPAGRTINIAQHLEELEPDLEQRNGWRDLRWRWRDLPPIVAESGRPHWHEQYPNVQLSEYSNWAEVVAWALPLYRTNAAQSELEILIDKWRNASADEADRVRNALSFVQDEIRYTGLEIGAGAYRPNDPSLVLRRRFGDCKDKALLLATMLNRMGVRAHPALVSTDDHRGILDSLPSPGAFDHVIVRVESGNTVYWLDPTRTLQGGTLETIQQARYGAALVIAEGTQELERIPAAEESSASTEVEELFDLTAGISGVGKMTVTTTYRGADADSMRRSRQSETADEVSRRYLNFYRKWYAGIRLAQPVSHSDDRQANVVVVKEAYEIEPAFAKDGDGSSFFEINSHTVDDAAEVPDLVARKTPLALDHPTHVEHRAVVKLPEEWKVETGKTEISGPGFRYVSDLNYANAQFQAHYAFKTLVDHIDAKHVPEYAQKIRSVRDDTYYKFTYGVASAEASTNGGGLSFQMLGAVILGIFGSAGLAYAYRHAGKWITPKTANQDAPVGLGGWMILPLLGTIVSPFVVAFALYELRVYAAPEVWNAVGAESLHQGWLHAGIISMISLGIVTLVGCLLCAFVLFTKDRRFPALYIAMVWLTVIWAVCSTLTAGALDWAAAEIPKSIAVAVRDIFSAIIWTAYMLVSQRVRATFTREPSSRVSPDAIQSAAA